MLNNVNQISLLCSSANQSSEAFEVFWRNNSPWFEAPNIRRGGWSGVVKCMIDSFGQPEKVFIKRQENHMTRTLIHPIKGIPTFLREYRNIQSLHAKNIPTLDVLYFDTKASKAVLVTKALEGYISLDKIELSTLVPQDKKALISSIAKIIRHLHHYHYQHNCLYPKHIMVRQHSNGWYVKLIDLEKLKYRLVKKRAVIHDLTTFLRHLNGIWSARDMVIFFQTYFEQSKLSCHSKKIIHVVCKKIKWKADVRKQFESVLIP
ncbi:lipopolysaccharide kinase InaA family protein [Methylophaga sp.]|uniref:lipopolysaccharide kinase InaA family protein n=1 Tax=Methylophaga sp. TaxID=2024840 RepID=UPI0027216B86|nr:lipopolysaccharide kinase InaA family protein [Methylophaga sp.]MDO8827457.1 lipopolysaccharide kinase InaA family protein [Methylophaga sp.]